MFYVRVLAGSNLLNFMCEDRGVIRDSMLTGSLPDLGAGGLVLELCPGRDVLAIARDLSGWGRGDGMRKDDCKNTGQQECCGLWFWGGKQYPYCSYRLWIGYFSSAFYWNLLFWLLQWNWVRASRPSLRGYLLITVVQLPTSTPLKRSCPNLNSNNLFLLPRYSFYTILV